MVCRTFVNLGRSAVAISHPLQTVKGRVCKVMVLHRAILLGPRMLYLHLIPRHCTSHDIDPIPRIHILRFVIVSLVVHAPEEAPPLAEYSRLTWSVCRIVSMARFAREAELKAFLGKLDADYAEYASTKVLRRPGSLQTSLSHIILLVMCEGGTLMTLKQDVIHQVSCWLATLCISVLAAWNVATCKICS